MAYNKETGTYEGFIYKIANDIDDVFYIGRTYRTIEKRWKEHQDYSQDHNTNLYRGMRKYGIEHFHISMIEKFSSTSKDEIKQLSYDKEKYWIKYYKDNGYELYNMNDGGNDVMENKCPEKPVIQYDLFCNMMNKYDSISEAADCTGIHHSDISSCCLKNGRIYCTDNYIWRYIDDPLSQEEIEVLNKRYRGVCQYDFDGNLLNIFYRPRDAAQYLIENDGVSIDAANISSCMNGRVKSAGGYIWRHRDDEFDFYPLPKQIRRVEQRSKSGELLNIFANCKEASEKTGVNKCGINQCCLKLNQQAGGFIWCYEGDDFSLDIREKEHPVDRYDLDKNYIDSYSSIQHASSSLNINYQSISGACNDLHKTAGGFIWRFSKDTIDTYIYDSPIEKKRPVRTKPFKRNEQIEQRDPFTGELLKTFENVYDAAKYAGGTPGGIYNCCSKDNNYICDGYYYCFVGDYDPNFKSINRYRNYDIYTKSGSLIKTVCGLQGCKEFLGNYSNNVGSGVKASCTGRQISAYGYIWRFSGESFDKYRTDHKGSSKRRFINQYSIDYKYLHTYKTITDAAASIGTKNMNAIIDCCNGFRDSYKDYIWEYADKEVKYA